MVHLFLLPEINQIEVAAMALTESWFPASPGIFSWLQLYLKCSVYTLTGGVEAAAAEYQVQTVY